MTLEQIKNRQERINEELYSLLSNLSVVVEKVVGVQYEEENSINEPDHLGSGLLSEITNSQKFTEDYISRLFNYQRLLSGGVFAPVEPCIEVKKFFK